MKKDSLMIGGVVLLGAMAAPTYGQDIGIDVVTMYASNGAEFMDEQLEIVDADGDVEERSTLGSVNVFTEVTSTGPASATAAAEGSIDYAPLAEDFMIRLDDSVQIDTQQAQPPVKGFSFNEVVIDVIFHLDAPHTFDIEGMYEAIATSGDDTLVHALINIGLWNADTSENLFVFNLEAAADGSATSIPLSGSGLLDAGIYELSIYLESSASVVGFTPDFASASQVLDMTIDIDIIPEPGSAAVLSGVLGMMGLIRRRA